MADALDTAVVESQAAGRPDQDGVCAPRGAPEWDAVGVQL